MCSKFTSRRGAVLILSLWAVAFLSILAVNIGMLARQKMTFLSRLERRAKLDAAIPAAVNRARGVAAVDRPEEGYVNAVYQKLLRHNNPEHFYQVELGDVEYSVFYDESGGLTGKPKRLYGLSAEEGKLNVNVVEQNVLVPLIRQVTDLEEKEAVALADAIVDWRKHGESQLTGFLSDDYYSNLEFPYPTKDAEYETPAEFYLLAGMTPELAEQLRPFLTVYGEGAVDVNTASPQVLRALGLSEEVVNRTLLARQGPDQIQATADDIVFVDISTLAGILIQMGKLTPEEVGKINELISKGLLGTKAEHFHVHAEARMARSGETQSVDSVFRASDGRILYWNQY